GDERAPLAAEVEARADRTVHPTARPAGDVEVRVLVAATRAPVPHAELALLDWDDVGAEERLLASDERWPIDRVLERFGRRLQADEHGIARVPRPARIARVVAASGGLWGELWIDAGRPGVADDRGRLALELEPDRTLSVRVVDEARRPVGGVPVVL